METFSTCVQILNGFFSEITTLSASKLMIY